MTFDYWRPRIISARVIAEGGRLPRGYGVAWMLPYSHAFYCLPVPFNRLVGSFRNWYLAWRRPCEDDPIAIAYHYGESQGYLAGNNHGYTTGIAHALAFGEGSVSTHPAWQARHPQQEIDLAQAMADVYNQCRRQ